MTEIYHALTIEGAIKKRDVKRLFKPELGVMWDVDVLAHRTFATVGPNGTHITPRKVTITGWASDELFTDAGERLADQPIADVVQMWLRHEDHDENAMSGIHWIGGLLTPREYVGGLIPTNLAEQIRLAQDDARHGDPAAAIVRLEELLQSLKVEHF